MWGRIRSTRRWSPRRGWPISGMRPKNGNRSQPGNRMRSSDTISNSREKMTMLKRIHVGAVLIAVLMLAPALMRANDSREPGHSYRLDFTISELEDGKKINSRQYAINLN